MTELKRWITVEAGDHTWLMDLDFLFSGYSCTFGKGCPGIHGDSSVGCCIVGTPLYDDELAEVKQRVEMLKPEEWQHHGKKWLKRMRFNKYTKWNTTVVDGGCIFANRKGFSGGEGCAFHVAAANRGENALDWKPTVCWTVPIHVEWHESINSFVVRMVGRADWSEGGEDFDHIQYWCTDDDASWTNGVPVFISHEEELQRTISMNDEAAWEKIKAELDRLWAETRRSKPKPKAVPVTLLYR